jgi:DUF1365 family protein
MRSSLYECRVMHSRLKPRAHRFSYGIFMMGLDLDELGALDRGVPLFSVNRGNLYSFRESDYLPTAEPVHNGSGPAAPAPAPGLKARVLACLAARGIACEGGRVLLLTLPRVAGYLFNPVSFYFCFGADGRPVAAIAEVTNTFREVKPYVIGPEGLGPDGCFRARVPKHFYVSPFSDVDVAFDFALRAPAQGLRIRIDDYAGADRTLASTLAGRRHRLTAARLAWWTVKYPLLTAQVILLIHAHALILRLKRVPWFAKAARAADQKDLYRPHASITPAQHA